MSELLALQRQMAAAVMQPLTREEKMPRRRADGTVNRAEAETFVKPNDRLTACDRLEIYNRQYWFRLYDSFEEDFPGMRAILGRKRFETLMRAYLVECPSTSFTLRNLGAGLENWLLRNEGYIAPHRDLALDMARLEWAHIEAFDSATSPVPSAEDFAAIDEDSVLSLQPHLRFLELLYPVDDLLIRVRSANGSSNASSNNASVSRRSRHVRQVAALAPERIYLAIHRHQNSVYYKRLHPEDFLLLDGIRHGLHLGEAIERAFEGSPLTEQARAEFLQSAFAGWASLGWFSK